MHTPDDADDAQKAAFRAARARWMVPPDGWENHQPTEVVEMLQLWDLNVLKTLSAYQFVGALCVSLGGNPWAVRAALGLQVVESRSILNRRKYMQEYRDALNAIEAKYPTGLDDPRAIFESYNWLLKNARSPAEAEKLLRQRAALMGMMKKHVEKEVKMKVQRGDIITPEDQRKAIHDATQNWLETAGKKLINQAMRPRVQGVVAETAEVLDKWQPKDTDETPPTMVDLDL